MGRVSPVVERALDRAVESLETKPKVSPFRIDFSAIDMFYRCPKQFEYVYVQGKRRPPSIAMADGTAHHTALESLNLHVRDKGRVLKLPQMIEVYEEVFMNLSSTYEEELESSWKMEPDWEGPKDLYLSRAQIFYENYQKNYLRKFEPTLVEYDFEIHPWDDHRTVFGRLDLATLSHVVDYKVVGRPKGQSDADQSVQLSLYSYATRRNRVAYVSFVKAKEPYIQVVESTRGPSDWSLARDLAEGAMKALEVGFFPYSRQEPQAWWCSERFCGFWKECPVGRSKALALADKTVRVGGGE